jgi:pSer/pThr/pTyr-binding forkhead associated (FHA) protein
MAIWKLTIEDDEGQKTVVPLVKDEYTLGRREGHSIRLTERNISRDHARIRRDGDGYTIEDAGSYNGVFVNGHRITAPTKLANGDMVVIGDYRVEPHDEDSPQKSGPASVAPKPAAVTASAPPSVRPVPAAETPPRLVLLTGPEAGREWHLEKEVTSIGRGDDIDMRVNHSSVSRHHCDVRKLADGRMEVVDKGSANGIRVNGNEGKSVGLSSGDVIELGDMQIRFIGAGQSYVYDPAVEAAHLKERGKRGGAFWGIVGLVIVAAVIGGVVLARQGGATSNGSGSGSIASSGGGNVVSADPPADGPLEKATKLMNAGDLDGAHGVVGKLASDSALRKDKRFVAVEDAWADDVLRRAANESDTSKRRGLAQSVIDSGADATRQDQAKELIAALDATSASASASTSAAPPQPSASSGDPGGKTSKPPTGDPGGKPAPSATKTTPTATTAPTSTSTGPTPTPGSCGSYGGDYGAAMRNKDYDCVKKMLAPKLNANAISPGEARYLKAACTALGDTTCAKRAADKLL